ncbi:saccharopine dehydrogenase family protein [Angustibacter sp. McL0619]|uniref:saccharopine dehydrogenase family protein n=1 Tax=Angustibacter sp. McL0619 TaxID=3415676 RepID=UPI003CED24AB
MLNSQDDREFDVVVFGATGFVGRLVADYLVEHAPEGTRIGLGGRSLERLEEVRRGLGERARRWPLLVADSADPDALAELAGRTRVVATTVGPYLRYGLPLAKACAAAGTHYADLTGEVLFVRAAIDACDEAARASGARIVHSCGFDSIPSDLGVLLLHQAAASDGAGELGDTTLVAVLKGGFSGGTIDSMRAQVEAVQTEKSLRRMVIDPYALSPDRDREPDLGDERDRVSVFQSDELGGWVGPFVMASFNTRIVRRSNALQGWAYGRTFRYRELAGYGRGAKGRATATAVTGVLGAVLTGMQKPRLRGLVDRALPSPGEGPSADKRAAGYFRMRLRSTTTSGAQYVATVAAQGDPGYAATAVMLGESALALADGRGLPDRAGVLTPATAMGGALVDRLRAAGLTLSVERRGE